MGLEDHLDLYKQKVPLSGRQIPKHWDLFYVKKKKKRKIVQH